ncbi:NF038122 family metalloprotease [Bradyrhizobium sp. SSUT112]|uniref:NF038122 family metalloprotease n=1 Tax=Bradyrhizobium sp. SSUT112 TaxID=3040604 RepID=UPI00244AA034|nr:NF038122 family metalloprotease [Bradyrhizobium sp. SSUT112]MDH2352630.1 NF038122 family metalloprotease [Bradyrhizobium sp. SSUT112]
MVDPESDDLIYTVVGNEIQGSYVPADSGATVSNASTPGAVISATSGGIQINLILDAAAQAAPTSFKNGLQQAAAILAANITDQITVNINIDYSGTGRGAAAGPDHGYSESYSWVRSTLISNASAGDTTFSSLPNATTIQGQSQVVVWNAQLKLWGVLAANDAITDDASAYFNTDISPSLLVGVALHELTHAWGRIPYGPPYSSSPDIFDLFRFTSPGVRLINGASTAPAAYFSLDGGYTKLADYGQNSDPSDFLNSGVQGPNDPFNEYYNGSTIQGLTSIDLKQLDALGFHLAINNPVAIEQAGATSLVRVGTSYFLDSISTGTGPMLKNAGAAVVAGSYGAWSPVAAEQVSGGGYDVAWKNSSTAYFSIWSTDSNGNFVTTLAAAAEVLGTDPSLEALEPTLHQDLNGDGTIGVSAVTIEGLGSTSLVVSGGNYYLENVSTGMGPALKYGGSVVNTANYTTWSVIGAEQVSDGGYDVVWKNTANGHYSVWSTDSTGNFVTTLAAAGEVVGTDPSLEALEPTLHQDLNGDGTIGVPAVTIEALGSTSLVVSGGNYYLTNISTGAGPTLKYGGSVVNTANYTTWSVIGAEQVSGGGYDVVWKNTANGHYSVWSTDSTGSFVTTLAAAGEVMGTDPSLQALEPTLHQDLNGDGTIGVPAVTIEALGSTSLVVSGGNYHLDNISTGTGPVLKYAGSVVNTANYTTWSVIAAEQVSGGGYDVIWKNTANGHYSVWSTDSAGNFVTTLAAAPEVLGSDPSLQALEPTLHQDLNGDGTIGASTVTVEALGSTSLVVSGGNYYLDNISTGTGPVLKYAGSVVNTANYTTWSVIAAEQVSGGGYDVVWKNTANGHYSVWSTDSAGNFVTTLAAAPEVLGTDPSLKALEPTLHQDLNGDGTIGASIVSNATIETFGSTSVVVSSGNYYLDNISTGTGPTLKYSGSVVNTANYTTWSIIGAEQVSGGGYDVVWKDFSNGHYSVWSTDSTGNFITTLGSAAEMLGSDSSLKALEPTLHQDLNGDGAVGAAPPASAGLYTSSENFAFNFTQSASSSTVQSELPDPMPAPADVQTASEHRIQPSGGQDVAEMDMRADFFHGLHDHGFLLG